jgi:hypothetical protein
MHEGLALAANIRRLVVACFVILVACLFAGCRSRAASYTAEVTVNRSALGQPPMSGKLYLRNGRMRVDWGVFAEVFDLKQRKGWRIHEHLRSYEELGSKDLSTYAPEMTNGSLCAHSQEPSQCKLIGTEVIEGRTAKMWDVYNPKGFHVYFWTDEQLEITLRMKLGDVTGYRVTSLRRNSVPDSMFDLPAGYSKTERTF